MQQLTCNIDLSNYFYYLFFSFVLIELKPFVLKGKALGEKVLKSAKKCEQLWTILPFSCCPLVFLWKKKAYTTTTERKSFGELFWPQRKTFQAGGRYQNPIKTKKTISTTEIFPLWPPCFCSAKESSSLEQGGVCFLFPSIELHQFRTRILIQKEFPICICVCIYKTIDSRKCHVSVFISDRTVCMPRFPPTWWARQLQKTVGGEAQVTHHHHHHHLHLHHHHHHHHHRPTNPSLQILLT